MNRCPRCDHKLREVEPNEKWLRHFCCDSCMSAYSWQRTYQGKKYMGAYLARGRRLREQSYES